MSAKVADKSGILPRAENWRVIFCCLHGDNGGFQYEEFALEPLPRFGVFDLDEADLVAFDGERRMTLDELKKEKQFFSVIVWPGGDAEAALKKLEKMLRDYEASVDLARWKQGR